MSVEQEEIMRNTNKLHAKPKPKLSETCTEVICSFRPARKLVIYYIFRMDSVCRPDGSGGAGRELDADVNTDW